MMKRYHLRRTEVDAQEFIPGTEYPPQVIKDPASPTSYSMNRTIIGFGDFVVRAHDGKLSVMTAKAFDEKYELVATK